MIARIEQNQGLKKDRKYYEMMKLYAGAKAGQKLIWKELSDEQRIVLVEKIDRRIREDRKKMAMNIVITLILMTAVMWLGAKFLSWLFA